jgi:hypothetical protein
MLLRVVDDGTFRDIAIKEGEMFLLPGTYARASSAHRLTPHDISRVLIQPHGLYGHGARTQVVRPTIPCVSQTLSE